MPGCGNIPLFRTLSWLPELLVLAKIHPVGNYFPNKKLCSTIKLFFVFKYVLHYTDLSKYLKKNRGSPCSFTTKGKFIPLSNLGKSLPFCTCTRSCARADVILGKMPYGGGERVPVIDWGECRYLHYATEGFKRESVVCNSFNYINSCFRYFPCVLR